MTDPTRIPVIVGIGEINDRPALEAEGLDSAELMAAAARAADADAGGDWLGRCDWVAITPQISFRQLDVPSLLRGALGIAPKTMFEAPSADGDSPVRHLNDAANAIGSGEAEICLLLGGEAVRTAARRAAAAGGGGNLFQGSLNAASELRRRYGLITPSEIYPFYENACRAAWGQSLAEGQAESGEIWSLMSKIAADAEGAWLKQPRSAAEITEWSAENRPIAFPYSKLTVANSSVNQAAALIVTSLAKAWAAGFAEDRLVFVGAGASAHESDEPLARAEWTGTPSMDLVLDKVLALNGLAADDLDHVELYSCFPCVPKMARRRLGFGASRPLTVHGGLTFGGGPIGNYMMHAAAAMVRELRRGGEHGLLYGNGGHCSHNHAIVLSRRQPEDLVFPQDYRFQAEADAYRGPIPSLGDDYEGPVTIETYTVFYDRGGAPTHGVVLALSPVGTRVVARVDAEDTAGIAFLTDGRTEPVGRAARTEKIGDVLHLRAVPSRS
ncbi:acetyl-CoA acetyltransferase [Novosphingobium sp. PS1R-30]|uniref:Acetyl-CoA acetyltransferase n=1 Tax=Novosphingobium anseongense TaxID=3133436 RepID=A0ABU8S168_9SPHN